jgi:hypothetical protein
VLIVGPALPRATAESQSATYKAQGKVCG